MSRGIVFPFGTLEITIPAGRRVAVSSEGPVQISQRLSFPNMPDVVQEIVRIQRGRHATAVFVNATPVIINAGAAQVDYEIGTAAVVKPSVVQSTPAVLNATGPLTAAMIMAGLITSTTAAVTDGTLPTGTLMDEASGFEVDDVQDWAVINTGPSAFNVLVAAGHTLVGSGAVVAGTAGRFRTRKTAVTTFVTYRV